MKSEYKTNEFGLRMEDYLLMLILVNYLYF